MAKRQNKLSLEEFGGLLVDVQRPSATANQIVVRGGSLQINSTIVDVSEDLAFDFYSAAGSPTLDDVTNRWYKVVITVDNSGVLKSYIPVSGEASKPAAEASVSDLPLREKAIAFLLAYADTSSAFLPIENPSEDIVDIRGINNAIKAIEDIKTTDSTPENKVVVFDVSGNASVSRDLDLNSAQVDTTLTVDGAADLNSTLDVQSSATFQSTIIGTDVSDANSYDGNSGAVRTLGGVSVAKDVFVGGSLFVAGDQGFSGDVVVQSTENATTPDGVTDGSIRTAGGVSIAKDLWVGEGIQEKSQITIGDGKITFGQYNADLISSFSPSTVDATDDVGKYTGIAIDSLDKVHISYMDDTSDDLKYTTNASGSFVDEVVDSGGSVGRHSRLDTDSSDTVHIAYYDSTNTALKYAYGTASSWTISTLDNTGDVGTFLDIIVDSSDEKHIAYYGDGSLKYTTSGTAFTLETLDSADPETIGLDTDSSNTVHISYRDTSGNLKYAFGTAGSFTTQVLDTGDFANSRLDVDSNDNVHIVYRDTASDILKYATNLSGAFEIFTVDSFALSGIIPFWTDLVVDDLGLVHITYYDANNTELKYALGNGDNFFTQVIDDVAANTGQYSSLDIDSSNQIHSASYDVTNRDLRYSVGNITSDITTALSSAITKLASGGILYIKRGDYHIISNVDVNSNRLNIRGEGSSTSIDTGVFSLRVATANDVEEFRLEGVQLVTPNASAGLQLGSGSGQVRLSQITDCRFSESGVGGIDIDDVDTSNVLIEGCISTTTTTVLK
jgi:hypothetical protein